MKKFSELIEKQNEVLKGYFKITKSDNDRHLAFGWASVSIRADGELIEDWQDLTPSTLFSFPKVPHLFVNSALFFP